jgi:uncharacterized Ntn-hydrolase superfamily protein
MIHPSTFSILGFDPAEQSWGVAVASKFLAVGAFVPYAKAGVGAVATQSYVNTTFGPHGLELMASGLAAQQALEHLIAEDEGRDLRQVGLLDARGQPAAYTGAGCFAWAGHLIGQYFTCQGNILTGPQTVQAMAHTFQNARGELADRLMTALAAGEKAGGDGRGKQAAALLVVKPQGGYAGLNDRYLDLRVDDDRRPVQRLQELVKLHHLYFGKSTPEQQVKIEGELAQEIQQVLIREGFLSGAASWEYDAATRRAFEAFTGRENLEERVQTAEGKIDPPALEYIRERFGKGHRPARRARNP